MSSPSMSATFLFSTLEDITATRRVNPLSLLMLEFSCFRGALEEGAPIRRLQPHGPLRARFPPIIWRKVAGDACIGSARILASAGFCTASSH